MNGSATVQLSDTLVGTAATGKSELHKSLNKTDLAGAQGQAFAKMLLAAQDKNGTTDTAEPELEAKTGDAKEEVASTSEETATAEAEAPSSTDAAFATLNPDLKTLHLSPAQSVLPLQSTSTTEKSAKGDVASTTGDGSKEKSTTTRTDKSSTNAVADASANVAQGKEMTEAMLLPVLPALPASSPLKNESTVLTGETGANGTTAASKSSAVGALFETGGLAGAGAEKGVAASEEGEKGAAAKPGTERAAAEIGASAAQGQQGAWSPYQATGDAKLEAAAATAVSGANPSGDAGAKPVATANKSALDGTSTAAGASSTASVTSDVARDPAPSVSSADSAASLSAQSSASSTSAAAAASLNAAHTAAANVPTAVTHEAAGAGVAPGQAAMQDAGSMSARADGLSRGMSATAAGTNANTHALLDSGVPTGREGSWQISSNRVEAGFANGQDSWTSVVAQRQQGQVTAMLEMGSSAEHNSTVAMLPQLSQHLADRQLPVDQLGASMRQQFGSEAGASNQGQQSEQSQPQSQRGQVVMPMVSSVSSAVTTRESGRNSVDGSRISVRA